MAEQKWTDADLDALSVLVEERMRARTTGVGDIEVVGSIDGLTSFPTIQEKEGVSKVVRVPMTFMGEIAEAAVGDTVNEALDATDAAREVAEHPTKVGEDFYVYVWNSETKAYDKTDIFVKGDPFSIAKTYTSIAEMEADHDNPLVDVGAFVLINTDNVEDEDNAKVYLKTETGFQFFVDMSGAQGFEGKTTQFFIGNIVTGAPGSAAAVSLSPDGEDAQGNPKVKMNFSIPQGRQGDGGESAYQLAVKAGFSGTEAEWLASLNGEDGASAYELAVAADFTGTEAEWLASLVGPEGKSAYEVAVDGGFVGTEAEWLASLNGADGKTPVFTAGNIQTGAPGSAATLTPVYTGESAQGNLTFRLDGSIPKGDPGSGSGNVLVPEENLVAGKKYLFIPDENGSAIGTFEEYQVPDTQVQSDFGQTDSTKKDFIKNKPVVTTQEYIDAADSALSSRITQNATDITAAKTDLREVRSIAEGATRGIVFDTKAQLLAWIDETYTRPDGLTPEDLIVGEHLLIKEVDVPDYWWTGTEISELETQKVDLTEFPTREEMEDELEGKANDSDVVKLAGNQTISGIKTYSVPPRTSAAPTLDAQLVPKSYADAPWAFYSGYNTVTSIANVPVTKRSVIANLASGGTLSLAATLEAGKEIAVKAYNTGSTEITITLTNSTTWESKDNEGALVSSVAIPAGGSVEINIWALNKYIVKTDAS